jgi:glycosyltransferase involved in cell wall biosynthesis
MTRAVSKIRRNTLQKRAWITWETQRRSIELAKKFGCELFIIEHKGFMRYPKSIFNTLLILMKTKPDVLFVQNPSMILASFVSMLKFYFKYFLVVDRHTTFLLDKDYKNIPWVLFFQFLSRLTIRFADITIVTNSHLAELVHRFKGHPFILPDILPTLKGTGRVKLKGKYNILMVTSFAIDEPVQEVLMALKDFNEDEVYLYVTGNYKKLDEGILSTAPPNVIFTGFLGEQDYINMLFSSDAIMVLTTASACMLCGCYEAVSAERPLITSDKDVLREYFTEAVFVDNTASGISAGIRKILYNIGEYNEKIESLKRRLTVQWEDQYEQLEKKLLNIQS